MNNQTLALYKIRIFKNGRKPVAVLQIVAETKKLAYLCCLQVLPDHRTWDGFYKRVARPNESAGIVFYKNDAKRKIKRKKSRLPQYAAA